MGAENIARTLFVRLIAAFISHRAGDELAVWSYISRGRRGGIEMLDVLFSRRRIPAKLHMRGGHCGALSAFIFGGET